MQRNKLLKITAVLSSLVFFTLGGLLYLDNFFVSLSWAILSTTLLIPVFLNDSIRMNFFHPYSYFTFFSFVNFCMGFFAFMEAGAGFANLDFNFTDAVYIETLLMLSVSFLILWLSYELNILGLLHRIIPLVVFPADSAGGKSISRFLIIRTLLLYLVGWLGRLSKYSLGMFKRGTVPDELFLFASVFQLVAYFAVLGFISLSYIVFKHYSLQMAVFYHLPLILLELMNGVFAGGRRDILIPFLLVLFTFHYARRKVSWGMVLVSFLVLVFLMAPMATIWRNLFFGYLEQGMEFYHAAFSATIELPEAIYSGLETWVTTIQKILKRFSAYIKGSLSVVQQVPDQLAFAEGSTFYPQIMYIFVPRVVWPEKPIFTVTQEFAEQFFGAHEKATTSAPIGLPAELYYNFGYPGILLIVVWGGIVKFLWQRQLFYSRTETLPVVRLYFAAFTVSGILTNILGYWPGLLRTTIVYYGFLLLQNWSLPRLVMYRARKSIPEDELNDL